MNKNEIVLKAWHHKPNKAFYCCENVSGIPSPFTRIITAYAAYNMMLTLFHSMAKWINIFKLDIFCIEKLYPVPLLYIHVKQIQNWNCTISFLFRKCICQFAPLQLIYHILWKLIVVYFSNNLGVKNLMTYKPRRQKILLGCGQKFQKNLPKFLLSTFDMF